MPRKVSHSSDLVGSFFSTTACLDRLFFHDGLVRHRRVTTSFHFEWNFAFDYCLHYLNRENILQPTLSGIAPLAPYLLPLLFPAPPPLFETAMPDAGEDSGEAESETESETMPTSSEVEATATVLLLTSLFLTCWL